MDLVNHARNVVALHLAAEAIEGAFRKGGVFNHEDFSGISTNDWNNIVAESILVAVNSRPTSEEYGYARLLLSERADMED
jgi:hypothetical protein